MFSPNKTTTFECESTPLNKKVVDCEINGWMETCKKNNLPVPSRPKLLRHIQQENSNERRVKMAKLRDFRHSLINQAKRKFSERTPITAESNSNSISSRDSHSIRTPRLPSVDNIEERSLKRVDISEFSTHQTHEIIKVNEQIKIAMLKLPQLSKRGPSIHRHLLGMDPSIIQNKITERHYRASKFLAQMNQNGFQN